MTDSDTHKKITLLVLTPSLECGGSERYVSLLCNYIDTNTFRVILAVLHNETAFFTITNTAVTVVDLKVKHVRQSLPGIRRLVKQYQPHLLYSSSNHLNLFLGITRRFFPKELIFIARESSVVTENTKRTRWPWLYHRLMKTYYRRLDHIICQSAYMQHDLVKHYWLPEKKTTVIPNPVETSVAPVTVPEPLTFITVARLSEEKGYERIIQALALLNMPFQYFIIGDGPQKQSLQQLVHALQLQEKIIFSGKLQQPFQQVNATLYLMGSYYEGFPNSVLEALSSGIPVVAYDVPGGIWEMIQDNQNGVLVKEPGAEAMCAGIEKALRINFNRILIQQQTSRLYDAETIVQRTEQFFRHWYEARGKQPG